MATTTGVAAEAARRRTFAVISHPDAGKSTITEALALHAQVIGEAGAVHGKAGRKGVVSDWMAMEQQRGISITSAVLQFAYRDLVVNLLDTPGHADFSEDTYRVLTAVDCAVMLLDAAKGLEPQTLKLFEVCRARRIPVITFINKWDRPGREPLALLDEIEQRIKLRPTPVTWPVGVAGEFHGVVDRRTGQMTAFRRTPGGATAAIEEHLDPEQAARRYGQDWHRTIEELELLALTGADHDQAAFAAATSTPVLFGAAVANFGVRQLLDVLATHAPAPGPRPDVTGTPRPVDAPFAGFVFKIQANMNKAHRDQLAFIRVCSGRFTRGMSVTHAGTGRPFATKYAQQMFGANRETIDEAYPGDVIGLVNATALGIGDTLHDGPAVTFPPLPSFVPEHFAVLRAADSSTFKRFRRGVEQLDAEGVVQVLRSDRRGEQAPVLAAVGPMQFEVAVARLDVEFGVTTRLEHLPYQVARRTDADSEERLRGVGDAEVLTRVRDGALLALFTSGWRMRSIGDSRPGLTLDELPAAG
ncbi:peptide chain release factor 3 [Micromonospora phaseoli]|uniref:Peptide chain release factor 3 n=1 Tax=Micromonospora phaseoli TaxID=1144548 RepID=A0A1H6Z9H3_9ACTN|nr:peptide chain release factor 3 [Micromonospora phaseoli]PZW00494.1 peptide chain release factor 3 (bRF-3) [Micromonospora phaseoli]GIJ80946.1 peptide chain release factor 3 [Micromonospora phaseoli]SEJ46210.1 peptide chain release factor 3 [Micromonospora phaseoli]